MCSESINELLVLHVKHIVDLELLVDWLNRGSEGVLERSVKHLLLGGGAGVWAPHDEADLGDFTAIISLPLQVVDDKSWLVLSNVVSQVLNGGISFCSIAKFDASGLLVGFSNEEFALVGLKVIEGCSNFFRDSTNGYHVSI